MSESRKEYCIECDGETGRAGAAEDSLYREDGTGPYCEGCFVPPCPACAELRAEVERLQSQITAALATLRGED